MLPTESSGLAREVYLWGLFTLARDCVVVPVGPVPTALVHQLKECGFDHAPVTEPSIGSSHKIIGLVETAHLRALSETGVPLERGDAAVRFTYISVGTTVDELLTSLSDERALLVMHIDQDEDGPNADVIGLLTISDLNRHPFRGVLYTLLASLEAALARLVEQRFPDPQKWIELLNEDHQAWVLGFWELSKRRGVDVGPVAATMLSHLINVVAKTKSLRQELGYASRSSYDDATGHIPDLRNKIMHPVRPLILDQVDVAALHDTVDSVSEFTARAESLIIATGDSGNG